MSNFVKHKIRKVKHTHNAMWDVAISDAREKIVRTSAVLFGLKKALSTLRRLRDSGQPWPGQK
jgi:hypothetical protein